MELSLHEVLGIAKKEFIKRKWLSTEPENEKSIEVKLAHIDEVMKEKEYVESLTCGYTG